MKVRPSSIDKNGFYGLITYPDTWVEWKVLIINSLPDYVDYVIALLKMLDRTKRSK